jgi:putative DNA primase/helicase
MMGYCLTAETRAEAMFILHGNGSNGKSVICNQLNYMAGEENVSAVQLHEFDQRFKRAAIYGKLINISTDIDDRNLSSTGLVKAIISGEPIDAEFKNKDSFSFRPFCKVVIGANHLPRVRDNSAGLFRRVIIFDFKHVFEGKEKDTSLGAKLRMETDGIFNWVLEGLKMLRENDFKFTLSRENKEMLNKLRTFNNPVKAFVDELCVVKPELVCEKKVVYGKYKQWCVRTNHAPKAENSFFEDLYRAFPEIEQTRPSKNGNRLMMLKGICLEDNYEYDDSDDKVIEMDKHRESRDSGADEPLSVDLDDDEIYFLDEV